MNPNISKYAANKIETLCEQGCSQVKQLLKKAKQGDEIVELTDFNRTEIDLIITELEQIMSVYVNKNDEGDFEGDLMGDCDSETETANK